jgi:hypothetical protein
VFRKKKNVRFAEGESNPRPVSETPARPIVDICRFLATPPRGPKRCLSFDLHEKALHEKTLAQLSPKFAVSGPTWEDPPLALEPLFSKIAPVRRFITYHDSLPLAVIMASSLLQLHETPWLCQNWNTSSIYLPSTATDDDTLDISAPYVSSELGIPTTGVPKPTIAGQHPDLVTLGIVLMELSQNKCLRQWCEENFQNNLADDDSSLVRKVDAAWKWYEQEVSWRMEWNIEYCTAIKLCLDARFLGNFTPQRMTLKDKGFREAIYRQIVVRLQKASDDFFSKQNISLVHC